MKIYREYNLKLAVGIGLLMGVLMLINGLLPAQNDFQRNRVITRIDLDEKANRLVQPLPSVLINAWRMGKIQAYYPNTIDAPMSWAVFARTFRIGPSVLDFDDSAFPCCNPQKGPQNREEEARQMLENQYDGFQAVVELIDDRRLNSETSRTTWDTKYVRVVWVDPQGILPDRNGAVFNYRDVRHILNRVNRPHPKNDAASLSLSSIVENREFTGIPINISGRGLRTLSEVQQRSEQFNQQEDSGLER